MARSVEQPAKPAQHDTITLTVTRGQAEWLLQAIDAVTPETRTDRGFIQRAWGIGYEELRKLNRVASQIRAKLGQAFVA